MRNDAEVRVDRVTRSIFGYGTIVAVIVIVVLVALPRPFRWPHVLAVAAVFVLPGRIQGFLWREFFRGRRAMDQGRMADALVHFARFEERLTAHPWIAAGIYLGWSVYTWNAKAMLANDVGACELALGRRDGAEANFERAIALDPGYPVPYFNLAVVAETWGDRERAQRLLADAGKRGFRGGTRERVIAMASGVLAAVEGR